MVMVVVGLVVVVLMVVGCDGGVKVAFPSPAATPSHTHYSLTADQQRLDGAELRRREHVAGAVERARRVVRQHREKLA